MPTKTTKPKTTKVHRSFPRSGKPGSKRAFYNDLMPDSVEMGDLGCYCRRRWCLMPECQEALNEVR